MGYLAGLRSTCLHPLWFGSAIKKKPTGLIQEKMCGLIVDIGCADSDWHKLLSPKCRYIGLDYYQTAHDWYQSWPDVYGHAEQLPFPSAWCDGVLLLNVLEHLPNPQESVKEAFRVLKPGGCLLIQVPFLYPLHDLPLDFHRFTPNGLETLANQSGFEVESLATLGHPVESAGLMLNVALSRGFLDLFARRNPLFLFVFILPFLVVAINVSCWLTAKILPANPMICQSLMTLWRKPA